MAHRLYGPRFDGVQAAVAGGLGISLLPVYAIQSEHRILTDRLPECTLSELALVLGERRRSAAISTVADFLIDRGDSIQDAV